MSNTKHQESKPPSVGKVKEDEDPGEQTKHSEMGALNHSRDKKPSALKVLSGKLSRIFQKNNSNTIEEDVSDLIDEHDPEGVQMGREERSILTNVLNMADSKVSDVMVPRMDIVAIEEKSTLDDIRRILVDKEHTRMPVYKESLDNVIGFVHIKDLIPLFGSRKKFEVSDVIREILFVPPSMKIIDLLVKMRSKRVHMALVLDEYGGTDGIVTMEDLVEEIVGEIEDEHDAIEDSDIRMLPDGALEVNARIEIEDLEAYLGDKLKEDGDEEDFETVGGMIFFMLGHVPEKGEEVEHPAGYIFKVLEADERRVKLISVTKTL